MMPTRPTLIVLAGPTAVGKTELSLEIAEHFGCHIISADSRQIYRGLEIGTAAPTPEMLRRVPHHMVGIKEIGEYFSAYEFERDVLELLPQLFAQNPVVLLTGGSMMYIDAVCDGIDEMPTISDEVRQHVWTTYTDKGLIFMQQWLRDLDPEYYAQVDLQNGKRVVHAIEICLMSGQKYSSLRTRTKRQRPFDIVRVALDRERAELFDRIERRVDQMMSDGLEAEARRLYPHRRFNALNTVGYKEMFQYFDTEIGLAEALRLIKRNTRRYAKKQLAWFRNRNEYRWFHPSQKSEAIGYIEAALRGSNTDVNP